MKTSLLITNESEGLHTLDVSSATGLISMLTESDPKIVHAALLRLLHVVDKLWYEIAPVLPRLESLLEDVERFDEDTRRLSASVASRVYFHLEEPIHSLRLALEGGTEHGIDIMSGLSRVGIDGSYIECLVTIAIEAYVKIKRFQNDNGESQPHYVEIATDDNRLSSMCRTCFDNRKLEVKSRIPGELVELDIEKLSTLVYLMFERCYLDGTYNYALGIAIEAKEENKIRQILDVCMERCDPKKLISILEYALGAAINLISSKSFRCSILKTLSYYFNNFVTTSNETDNIIKISSICLCQTYQILGTASPLADIVETLLTGSKDETILGLQLCFNIADTGDHRFCEDVYHSFQENILPLIQNRDGSEKRERGLNTHTDYVNIFEKAKNVLVNGFTSDLSLSFLCEHSESDGLIMESLKKTLNDKGYVRNSILHNCAVITHSYLYAGTSNDLFLRDNLDWMKKASNWAKFSATASLGVIHAGYTTEAMTLLNPYLPQTPVSNNSSSYASHTSIAGGYTEGGSLYALGIIHGSRSCSSAVKRKEANDYLRAQLRTHHSNEIISHGAALGVGLTALGSKNIEIVNELKETLYSDSAIAGESAGLAIGMILVGFGISNIKTSFTHKSGSEKMFEIISELMNYSKETQHEKIIRGIAIGISLISYGQEDNADALIDQMRCDRDPILRYGAQYALAMAYCGTGSSKAIRTLLHTAVSDVSDDVRMASVLALPFILHRTPDRVPQLIRLLIESFNPHIRYASCMAVGISMAGTGNTESLEMLEPLISDMTDFVRQGALIASSMIYMQQSDECNRKKIKAFRDNLLTIVSDKHNSTVTKMGAILAIGIIDAGGRNCSLCLGSKNGLTNMTSAVGLVLWLQYWYWFPMMHNLSLSLIPTITIGLNKDLKYPKNFNIICNSKPSMFSYPKKMLEKMEEKKKRIETAILSTTAKNNARLARKRARLGTNISKESSVVESIEKSKREDSINDTIELEPPDTDSLEDKITLNIEPKFFFLSNPCRITRAQSLVCAFDSNQRYIPIFLQKNPHGIIMLVDKNPNEKEDLGAVINPSIKFDDKFDASKKI